mmetsp:Transcript_14496/g.36058  ORF Transcript_14496/g.36058 Transcript_14496/m.36058 type:complete len:420 (-) Transcript_14496:564-1823(-)
MQRLTVLMVAWCTGSRVARVSAALEAAPATSAWLQASQRPELPPAVRSRPASTRLRVRARGATHQTPRAASWPLQLPRARCKAELRAVVVREQATPKVEWLVQLLAVRVQAMALALALQQAALGHTLVQQAWLVQQAMAQVQACRVMPTWAWPLVQTLATTSTASSRGTRVTRKGTRARPRASSSSGREQVRTTQGTRSSPSRGRGSRAVLCGQLGLQALAQRTACVQAQVQVAAWPRCCQTACPLTGLRCWPHCPPTGWTSYARCHPTGRSCCPACRPAASPPPRPCPPSCCSQSSSHPCLLTGRPGSRWSSGRSCCPRCRTTGPSAWPHYPPGTTGAAPSRARAMTSSQPLSQSLWQSQWRSRPARGTQRSRRRCRRRRSCLMTSRRVWRRLTSWRARCRPTGWRSRASCRPPGLRP